MTQLNTAIPTEVLQKITQDSEKIIFHYDLKDQGCLTVLGDFVDVWGIKLKDVDFHPDLLLDSVFIEDKEDVKDMISLLASMPYAANMEFRIVNGDQSLRTMYASLSSNVGEDGSVDWIGGLVEDISARRLYEENTYEYSARKNSVLEILKHDLSGQVAMVKNIAELLFEKAKAPEQDSLALQKKIGLIRDISKQSIDFIMEITKDEYTSSVEMPLNITRFDIVKRICDVIDTYKLSQPIIGKKFDFSYSNKIIMVELDDVKFIQAINNLISNALKFTSEDGEIIVRIEDREDQLFLSIQDDGIGIPKEFHDSLFERYTMARRPGLKGEKTMGLGMSIVKTMIERHQGKIWFESQENVGTTFYIEVPKSIEQNS
ncbi:MAG TPA: HAMP domain-containing sensor histidine kinase [Cytophagaceae bacterium]